MESDLERYRKTFFAEAVEHLTALETALLRLEGGPHDPAVADDAFRAVHSLKGGADAVGFPRLTQFAHGLEEVLDRCRGSNAIPPHHLDLLLEATDILAQLVNCAKSGSPEPLGVDGVLNRLTQEPAQSTSRGGREEAPEKFARLLSGSESQSVPSQHETNYIVTVTPHADALRFGLDPLPLLRELSELGTVLRVVLQANDLPALDELDPEQCYLSWRIHLRTDRAESDIADVFAFACDTIQSSIELEPQAESFPSAPELELSSSGSESEVRPLPAPNSKGMAELRAVVAGKPCAASQSEVAQRTSVTEIRPPAPAPIPEPTDAQPGAARRPANTAKETVRVDKDRLDKLINTIGELVIAQSMAQQEFDALTAGSGELSLALPELSKISRDLQELSLSLRMVPLQGTFQKMTRLVRDLSRKMNKPVELELHGEETELDKTVVDQLGDPLMHMVRNAVDHGLESPEDRIAAGKLAEGRVTLRAYHQGGNVYIELTDDGWGLDRDRILSKAVEKGLVAEGQRLADSEIYALIFAPGFSTAKTITDVSGRGVGMDVVRRNVEALQGNILIRTQLGKGTTFTIRLPLTLAIMDGLMVGLGDDVYVLPLLSVVESFRPRPVEVRTVGGRGEVVNVRGEVVPLLRLHQLLGRGCRVTDPCRGLVVLVEDQGKKHAILVDELLGQMQAVVKSLDTNYRRVEGLAGATILGDGRVAMILDIHGLIQLHTQFGGRVLTPARTIDSERPFGDTP